MQENTIKVTNMICFEGKVVVESQGHSDGVAMLWRNKDEVTLNSFSKNHIDVQVTNKDG